MKFLKLCVLLILFFFSLFVRESLSQTGYPDSVFSKLGNIYYTEINGQTIQITSSGKDSSPVLASNKKIIAFVRTGNEIIPDECDVDTETNYGNQIWTYDLLTRKERLLVANNFECKDPKKQIIDPSNLIFSPNDKTLYFLTSAWTTSGAVHDVNINNGDQRFIADANELEVVPRGEYKGYLIVNRHRYFLPPGGSYDWYWLVNPEGKEEGTFGPEITKAQRDFIES